MVNLFDCFLFQDNARLLQVALLAILVIEVLALSLLLQTYLEDKRMKTWKFKKIQIVSQRRIYDYLNVMAVSL